MSVFFEQIRNLKNISNVQEVDSDNSKMLFTFDGLVATAQQITTSDIIVSRIAFPFSYEKPKSINRTRTIELINKINSRIPLVKVILKKVENNQIRLTFSIEYTFKDALFTNINIDKDLDILISSTIIFQDMLKGNSKILDE